ncbi:MAG: hypothetical protein AAF645_14300 [Myxococcota bacterium]
MRLAWIFLSIIVTAIGFGIAVDANVTVMGMPVVGVAEDVPCWIALGTGRGVLFIGAFGAGVVCFSFIGAGLLFAVGQVAAGAFCVAQAGIGLSMFLGQVGFAFTTIAQGSFGALSMGQVARNNGKAFFARLYAELKQIITLRAPYPADD